MDVDQVDNQLFDWGNEKACIDFAIASSLASESRPSKQVSSKNECIDFVIASSLASESRPNKQVSSKDEEFTKLDSDFDYAIAMSLQAEFDEELKENENVNSKKSEESLPLSIIDEEWELIDPHPDIHALFMEYDTKFFYGKLKGVIVKWSKHMTLCAGVCSYEGRGGLCSVRLSEPLLKFRPRRDLIETLLHEMIHAYLFVTNFKKDREEHGPSFLSHMYRINKESGANITVYHDFKDEVELYKKHWWKCDGPCKDRGPYYGILKRAMNRAPGPNDKWWAQHQALCGGKFVKIKEPDYYSKKKATKRKISDSESKSSHPDIRKFFKDETPSHSNTESSHFNAVAAKSSTISNIKTIHSKEDNLVNTNSTGTSQNKNFVPFQGTGHELGDSSEKPPIPWYFSSRNLHELDSVLQRDFPSPSEKCEPPVPWYFSSRNLHLLEIERRRNLQSGQTSSSSSGTTNNSTKTLIQSPIERFLYSRNAANPLQKKTDSGNIHRKSLESDTSKVPCPICSALIKKDDLVYHAEKCLLNN